jgi:hypothetical protein
MAVLRGWIEGMFEKGNGDFISEGFQGEDFISERRPGIPPRPAGPSRDTWPAEDHDGEQRGDRLAQNPLLNFVAETSFCGNLIHAAALT